MLYLHAPVEPIFLHHLPVPNVSSLIHFPHSCKHHAPHSLASPFMHVNQGLQPKLTTFSFRKTGTSTISSPQPSTHTLPSHTSSPQLDKLSSQTCQCRQPPLHHRLSTRSPRSGDNAPFPLFRSSLLCLPGASFVPSRPRARRRWRSGSGRLMRSWMCGVMRT